MEIEEWKKIAEGVTIIELINYMNFLFWKWIENKEIFIIIDPHLDLEVETVGDSRFFCFSRLQE